MTASNWRMTAQRVIAPIEQQYRDQPYGALKRALHAAYPFGLRSHHPYKIWCEEQRFALARHPEAPVKVREGELFNSESSRS